MFYAEKSGERVALTRRSNVWPCRTFPSGPTLSPVERIEEGDDSEKNDIEMTITFCCLYSKYYTIYFIPFFFYLYKLDRQIRTVSPVYFFFLFSLSFKHFFH